MKRVLSLILAISMVMSMFSFAFAGTALKDVVDTDYESAVEALVELGIVNGYEDGTYRPEQNVSRAEMAKLLVVAAGLEPAAKLAEGATKFSDVNGGWASGYVNVASEYGYVMGDPEGTFRPDDTVSYAEAATMALRVLGYKSVVEAKGTWPTNYIAKAEDLKLMEDITFSSYNDGAARGNVAILVWNMLTTKMWTVTGESEGDGLMYADRDIMLNVKFPDYTYTTAQFVDFAINDDAEVMVTVAKAEGVKYEEKFTFAPEYEYFENDFYTFVPGTEVEVLINDEDETLLSMVRTGKSKLVEGIKEDIDEDYDELSGDANYLYAYGLVERRAIKDASVIKADSAYIFEVDASNKNYVKFNDETVLGLARYRYEDMEKEIFLKDGERATVEDVEVGDVLTKVSVYYPNHSGDAIAVPTALTLIDTFYMIGASEVEGKLTKVVFEDFEAPANAKFLTATIGGEEYPMAAEARFVEDTDDMDDSYAFVNSDGSDAFEQDMNGEEVTAVLDVFGRVVMVMFDGEIDAGEDNDEFTVKFVTVAGGVERDGDYMLPVVTEDGEDTLTFASKELGNSYWRTDIDLTGYFTLVMLNEDGEIEAFKCLSGDALSNGESQEDHFPGFSYRESGDIIGNDLVSGEYVYESGDDGIDSYVVSVVASAKYNKNTKSLENTADSTEKYPVGSKTVVVSLIFDDKGTVKTSDDEYRVTYTTGIGEIDNMRGSEVVVIMDNATKLGDAKYVVIFDEVATGEDDLVGILTAKDTNEIGETLLTITDTRIVDKADLKEAKKDAMILSDKTDDEIEAAIANDLVAAVLYSTEVNKNDQLEVIVEAVILHDELLSGDELFAGHGYIDSEDNGGEISEDGRRFTMKLGNEEEIVDLDDEDYVLVNAAIDGGSVALDFEDYRYIIVNVDLDDDDEANLDQYVIESYKEVEFADVEAKHLDRISIDPVAEIVVVYRGFPEAK